LISIIIRTKNEERWISRCLRKLLTQTYTDFEVILVDNLSTDNTVKKALDIVNDIKVIDISEFLPGKAINLGIESAKGELIAILSAHCIPVHNTWLEKLASNFKDKSIAGVYGRQVPITSSSALNKRDLHVTFGLDKRIQKKDYFFHNANSMIRRDIWEKFPFDNDVTNIEDRVWGKEIISKTDFSLLYEPEAPVFHHHGIHQDNKIERAKNVVRIMETMDLISEESQDEINNLQNFNIYSFIPIKEKDLNSEYAKELLKKTIYCSKSSIGVSKTVVITDSKDVANMSKKYGSEFQIIRPKSISSELLRVDDVCKYALKEIEKLDEFPDIIVTLEIFFPLRPITIIDTLLSRLIIEELDTVMAGIAEYGIGWQRSDGNFKRVDNFNVTKSNRDPVHFAKIGFGSATYADIIREGSRLGNKVGIYEVDQPIITTEIRTRERLDEIKDTLKKL
jgi:rhamnosyltransferase